MKHNFILFCLLFTIAANSFTTAKAQAVNVNDSLALVDLYNNTNGPNWTHHDNWLTSSPVSTWAGVVVTGTRVTSIDLFAHNLTGNLSSSIGNLVNLAVLDLNSNHLTGAVPIEIGNLANLVQLYLSNNQLSGAIPVEIGNLVNLVQLYLSNNQLSGAIPSSFGNLTKLQYLDLDNNQLSGAIPVEIGNLVTLTVLVLNNNQLTGTIPATIGNLKKLQFLYLYINQLSGAIPATIGKLVKLDVLQLFSNQLSGTIPIEIGKLANLTSLDLRNNQLSGVIPSSIGNLAKLRSLDLDNNQLSGAVPVSFSKLTQLYSINISFNRLSQEGNIHFFDNKYRYGYVNNNLFTFDGLQFIATQYPQISYAPQNTVLPIHQNGNALSVSAGGTLSNNTYKWFKVGQSTGTTITGDSTFTPVQSGQYYALVTNAIATQLTLTTDTITYTAPLARISFSSSAVMANNVTTHFSVYPNPAKDILHLQTNGTAIITLTNSAGKVLLTKNINNTDEINVSAFANGIYYIKNKITGEVQKIVVTH